jgi:transcriptional regulator with XRE-family HTH domain
MVSTVQLRMARAALGWSLRELAERAQVHKNTALRMEAGQPAPTASFRIIQRVLEDAGIEFLDPIEGVRGEGVAFKWGVTPPARQPNEGTAPGAGGDRGLKAAWDDFEEAVDLDALLGEEPAPDPDMADYWRTDPELWARLSEGGRETLSCAMFGDRRAAGAGYFRSAEMS